MKLNGIIHKDKDHPVIRQKLTFGQRAADKLTQGMGSWIFIIWFLILTAAWIVTNSVFLVKYYKGAFDPFPFILLNLTLSCLSALQAPIILMSQNRQGEKDRIRSEYDYSVNRKAEREVAELQKSIDSIKRKLSK